MTWINRLGLGLAALALACAPALAQTISYSPNTLPLSGSCGTVTAVAPCLDLTQTWNNAGVTFYGFRLNVTNTASASASLLMDLQVAGASKFSVRKDGVITLGGGLDANGNDIFSVGNLKLGGFASDVILTRDAANTLALRNGASAQTFNVYGTYTDASNYERGVLGFSGNELLIGTGAAGTGTGTRTISLQTNNTTRWQIGGSSGGLLAAADNTYDIGAAGANRPRDIIAARYQQAGVTTVGALKTCNATAEGSEIVVSDANATTFHSTVAAGGSNHVKVVCLNSAWTIGG